mgnify:FL=1
MSYLLIADNNFTFPRKRAVEFCRKMIDSGLSKKLTFSCQTNTRFPLDEELVCLMREAGFCRINFGLERLTTYSLQKINKMQPFQGVHDALTLVSKHNIDPSIFMMIGFPFETEELLEQEKELFLDLKKYTHRLFLSVLCPMPGTMYYDGSPKIKEWYLNRDAYLMFRAYFTNVLDMHTFNTIERNFFNLSKPVQHALKNYYLLFKKITHGSVFNKKTPLLSLCLNLDFLVAKISQACFYFSPSLEFFIFNHIKSLRYYAGNYFLSGYMLKKNLVADE